MKVTRAFALLVLWLSMGAAAHAQPTQAAGLQEYSNLRGAINQAILGTSDTAVRGGDLVSGSGKLQWDDFGAWSVGGWRLRSPAALESLLGALEGSTYPSLRSRGTCAAVAGHLAPLRGQNGRINKDWWGASTDKEKAAYEVVKAAYDAAMAAVAADETAFRAQNPAQPATTTATPTGTGTSTTVTTVTRPPDGTTVPATSGQGAPRIAQPGAPLSVLGVTAQNPGAVAASGGPPGSITAGGSTGQGGPPFDPGKGGPYLPPFQQQPNFPQPWNPNQQNPAWNGANTIAISVDPRTGGIVINGNPQLIAQILNILNAFAAQGGNGAGPINIGLPPGNGGVGVFPPQQYPPQQYPPQQFPFPQQPFPQQPFPQQPFPQQPFPQQPFPQQPFPQQPFPQQPFPQQPFPQQPFPQQPLPQQPFPQQPLPQQPFPQQPLPQLPFPQQPVPQQPFPQQPLPQLPFPQQPFPQQPFPQQPFPQQPGGVPAGPSGTLPPVPGKGGIQVGVTPGGGIVITLPGVGQQYPYPQQPGGVPGQPGYVPLAGTIDPQGNLRAANGQPVGVRAIPQGNGQIALVDNNGYQVGRVTLQQGPNGQYIGTLVSNSGQVLGQVVYGPDGSAQIYDIRNQGGYLPQVPIASYPPVQTYPPMQYPGQVGQFPRPFPPGPGKGGVVLPGTGQYPGQFPPFPGKGGGVVIVERPPVPPYQGPSYEYPWDRPDYPGTPPFIPTPPRGGPLSYPPYPQPYPQPYPGPRGPKINGTELAIATILGAGTGVILDKRNPGKGLLLGGLIFGAADLLLQSTRKSSQPQPPPYTYINPNLPDKGPLVMQSNNGYYVHQNGAMVDQYGQQVLNVNQEGLITGPRGDFLGKFK